MEKYQTAGRYSKTVSSDLESRLDLSALCVQGQRNEQRIFSLSRRALGL